MAKTVKEKVFKLSTFEFLGRIGAKSEGNASWTQLFRENSYLELSGAYLIKYDSLHSGHARDFDRYIAIVI